MASTTYDGLRAEGAAVGPHPRNPNAIPETDETLGVDGSEAYRPTEWDRENLDRHQRLECLRFATPLSNSPGIVIDAAQQYYTFVSGDEAEPTDKELFDQMEHSASSERVACADIARVYALKAEQGGVPEAAKVAKHIAQLIEQGIEHGRPDKAA
jgi:hypothetical protein